MKQFEKWFNKAYPLPPTIEREPVGRYFKAGCNEAWKAALRMIKYEGVISDYELASKVIKDELQDDE